MIPWLNATVQVSVSGLVLLAVGGATAMLLAAWMLVQGRHMKGLAQEAEEGNNLHESSRLEKSDAPSIPEAYLQFIYNLSHEVSNPLQSVQTNLENMADCSPEEVGRWKQYYAIIRQELKRLSTLTENLRLLSQLESVSSPVKREPVNLRSVIEDVIMAQAERAESRNINLNYQGPNRPARILGNRGLLHEVILNLIDNSIKYSKDGSGEIVIHLREGNDLMHVTIKDNGLGIPAADLPFIFNTAYRSSNQLTVHRKGSGLGLAIVQRIINQHDGEIRAESLPEVGTTISIDLPLYRPNDLL